ncbi:hypothetical protein KP509_05G030100 [Ceratopteris richardii]|uniref:Uncharacterized protein n=1 Tax=Ceratopteris richardii TaxID=49495 RepID=A0A8T2UTD1_CERRI|nr:hypothetical protein KP509_05G030100 [Ceratopteris richardii]
MQTSQPCEGACQFKNIGASTHKQLYTDISRSIIQTILSIQSCEDAKCKKDLRQLSFSLQEGLTNEDAFSWIAVKNLNLHKPFSVGAYQQSLGTLARNLTYWLRKSIWRA